MNGPTPSIPLGHAAMDDTAAYAARGPLSAADLDARIAEKRWDQPLPTPAEAEAELLDLLRTIITPAADADIDFCGLGDFSCANVIFSSGMADFIPDEEHKDRRFFAVYQPSPSEALSQVKHPLPGEAWSGANPLSSEPDEFIDPVTQPLLPAEASSEFQGDDEAPTHGSHGLKDWISRHPKFAPLAILVVLLALWGLAGWSDGDMLPGEGEAYADELLATAAGFPASEPQP